LYSNETICEKTSPASPSTTSNNDWILQRNRLRDEMFPSVVVARNHWHRDVPFGPISGQISAVSFTSLAEAHWGIA
jgi:hypothetical protein